MSSIEKRGERQLSTRPAPLDLHMHAVPAFAMPLEVHEETSHPLYANSCSTQPYQLGCMATAANESLVASRFWQSTLLGDGPFWKHTPLYNLSPGDQSRSMTKVAPL